MLAMFARIVSRLRLVTWCFIQTRVHNQLSESHTAYVYNLLCHARREFLRFKLQHFSVFNSFASRLYLCYYVETSAAFD